MRARACVCACWFVVFFGWFFHSLGFKQGCCRLLLRFNSQIVSSPPRGFDERVAASRGKHVDTLVVALVRSIVKRSIPIAGLNGDAGWACFNYRLQLLPSFIVLCSVMRSGSPILPKFKNKKTKTDQPPPHQDGKGGEGRRG